MADPLLQLQQHYLDTPSASAPFNTTARFTAGLQQLYHSITTNRTNHFSFVGKRDRDKPAHNNPHQLVLVQETNVFTNPDGTINLPSPAPTVTAGALGLPTPTPPAADYTPPLLAHRYQYLKPLGEGAFSQTLLARDTYSPGKHYVAIKVMNAKFNEIGVQESKKLRFLHSSNASTTSIPLIRLITTFTFSSHFCLVLELLDGGPLSNTRPFVELCAPVSPAPSRDTEHRCLQAARKITAQLLTSLAFLQRMRVIHADLKPENVLKVDAHSNKVKLIDFGNAMTLDEAACYLDDFDVQSLLYRAPEVLLGADLGFEIDVWSLGCVLCELFLGRPPFQGTTRLAIVEQIVRTLGPLPDRLRAGKFYTEEMAEVEREWVEMYEGMYGFKNGLKAYKRTRLLQLLPNRHPDLLDLLIGLLEPDPTHRLTPTQGLKHPFLEPLFPLGALGGAEG